jgi:drug/metabolite transporter (DMT)-like permease
MDSTVVGVALACLASCLFNAGIAIQAIEARKVPPEHGLRLSLIGRLLQRPRWLVGTALNVLAIPTQTAALLLAPLTVVQPADAAGLLLLLFLGSRVLGERVGTRELGAVGAIVAGITILTAAAPEREVTHIVGGEVIVPLLVVAAVALAPIALRRVAGPDSLLVVLGAGFAFALSAFAIKVVADGLDRGEWVTVVAALAAAGAAGLAGMLSEQTALQRRQATQVAPIIFVVELLVPVALAVLVVGEDWGGEVAPIAAALALIVAGVVALARAPQVAGLLGAEAREGAGR